MGEIRKLNVQELDVLTSKLYNEFFSKNQTLFKEDLREYARQAFDYVRQGIREVQYFGKEFDEKF